MKTVLINKKSLKTHFPALPDSTAPFQLSILLLHLGVLLTIIALFSLENSITFYIALLPAIVIIGALQYALAQAAHEAVHHHISRKSLLSKLNLL